VTANIRIDDTSGASGSAGTSSTAAAPARSGATSRTSNPPTIETRRQPQQQRSRAKVDAILDAADAMVAEDGADALTTTLVAEKAGVAIGTLYQYFDGVPAIVKALVARHADRFAALLAEALAASQFHRKRDAANTALDALIAYYRADPSFRGLWRGAPRVTGAAFGDASDALVAIVTNALVAQGMLATVDEDFEREAQVQWAVATALIQVAFSREPDQGDPIVLEHLRRLFDLDVRTAADYAAIHAADGDAVTDPSPS
jgi:AcrR family transcriptional regulator